MLLCLSGKPRPCKINTELLWVERAWFSMYFQGRLGIGSIWKASQGEMWIRSGEIQSLLLQFLPHRTGQVTWGNRQVAVHKGKWKRMRENSEWMFYGQNTTSLRESGSDWGSEKGRDLSKGLLSALSSAQCSIKCSSKKPLCYLLSRWDMHKVSLYVPLSHSWLAAGLGSSHHICCFLQLTPCPAVSTSKDLM